MWGKRNTQNVSILLLLLLLIFGSTISLISNTSKIYSIIIEDLKKKVFKEETILSYIYSISVIGFCIIPSGIIFSKPCASRNVLLYGIIVTLIGYISLYITQKVCLYYMKEYLLNDLSNSILFIFLYGISFGLILQGGVTLNLGSLWINLLYWPVKYSGLITSIQFTMYSVGGLILSEIYRLFFLETGSMRQFFLTCFCISIIIGFLSIYMIISIEKKIILNNKNLESSEYKEDVKIKTETENEISHIDINENSDESISDISNDEYLNEYSKNENFNKQSIINKLLIYNENRNINNFILKNENDKESIFLNSEEIILTPTIYSSKSDNLLKNNANVFIINKFNQMKSSITKFIKLVSNLETISLIFVYLFTISTGQFFGTFIQRFSIYYIPDITKEKSIRMIQILTSIELFVRVLSGYISDLLDNNQIVYKSSQTIILTLTMSLSLLLINYLKSYWLVVIFGVGFSYAGMYSIAPSYIRSLYKPNEFALVNSFCYSMVIPGNLILSIVLANTPQKYTTSLQIIGYLSLIPLSIMIVYKLKSLYHKCMLYRDSNEDDQIIENIESGIDKIVEDITILQQDISNIQKVMSELNIKGKNNKKNFKSNKNSTITVSTSSSSLSIFSSSDDISKSISKVSVKTQ